MNKNTRPKKSAPLDWHRADIVAALRKTGWSLRKLSAHHGYASPSTLTHALDRPWPKGEKLIAAAIGVALELIWPTRYKGSTPGANNAPVTDRPEAA
jgi:Ner family transcriptional regulator